MIGDQAGMPGLIQSSPGIAGVKCRRVASRAEEFPPAPSMCRPAFVFAALG
jgi:hypothetical protein